MSPRRLPSLSALRAFEAAARHESAKQAAQELSVTATAISHQIRGLEEALGVELFVRKPRQLLLTPKGRDLQEVLETAFDNIGNAIERMKAVPSRQAVTLSTTPAVAWRLVRSQTGRIWMAVRDMDTAAAVIGIPVVQAKLKAFFVGATVCGIAGALWAFAYLGTVDARSFDLDRSFQVMFVIIIGGMGSLAGSFIGAAFIVLLPILLSHVAGIAFGGAIDGGQLQNLQHILFGGLIVWLLIHEPDGLSALASRL